ncbi:MAG: squalene/phytoene synthase family protein [Alphaproteobacteria bacterium]|nr:squalene/phytoene synthase family protein [Alphaproteobacteria bacterium]
MTNEVQIDAASDKNRNTENFPVGSFLIRPELRPHIHVFYNFARAADEIADHPLLDAKEKITRLEKFAISLLDGKNDDVPEAVELRKSLRQTGVSPQHSLDLLTAFKRDATQRRYRDWFDLIDYCNFSAAPVGRHVLELHGIGRRAWRANDSLCNALQIINHIQGCADDYRELDRVYLPLDLLSVHGAAVEDLSREKSTENLKSALHEVLGRVIPMLKDARMLPLEIQDIRLRAETSVICVLAEKLVKLLRRRDPLCDGVKLSKPQFFWGTVVGIARAIEW